MLSAIRTRTKIVIAASVALLAAGGVAGYLIWDSHYRLHTTSPADVRADGRDLLAAVGDGGGVPPGEVDCAEATCVALTFDSSPGEYTAELLDILAAEEVPATFFLLGKGQIEEYPELVTRIADEGHEVANHTWNHPRLTELEPDEIREELERTQEAILELTGEEPTLMRPPQGRTNNQVSEISEELGLAQILWSVTAKDYQTDDPDVIHERVMDQVERDGIILLHDIYDGTVPAVPAIIADLKAEGYTFVTVPQLFAPGVAEPGEIYR